MAGIHGHDFDKGLLLVLHTPGGMAEAAQTIADYLRRKFSAIDVLVPTYATPAGTKYEQLLVARNAPRWIQQLQKYGFLKELDLPSARPA